MCPPVWDLITALVATPRGGAGEDASDEDGSAGAARRVELAHTVASHFIGILLRTTKSEGSAEEKQPGEKSAAPTREADAHQSAALAEWVIRALAASGSDDSALARGAGPDAVASPQAFAALCASFRSTSVHTKAVVCRILSWIVRRWRLQALAAAAAPSTSADVRAADSAARLALAKARLQALPLARIETLVQRRLARESTSVASKAPLCFSAYVRALAALAVEAARYLRDAAGESDEARDGGVALATIVTAGACAAAADQLVSPSAPIVEEAGRESLTISWFDGRSSDDAGATAGPAASSYTVAICECSATLLRARGAAAEGPVDPRDAKTALAERTFDVVYEGAEAYCKIGALVARSTYACRVRSVSAAGAISPWSSYVFATVGSRVPFGFDPVRCGPNIALESLDANANANMNMDGAVPFVLDDAAPSYGLDLGLGLGFGGALLSSEAGVASAAANAAVAAAVGGGTVAARGADAGEMAGASFAALDGAPHTGAASAGAALAPSRAALASSPRSSSRRPVPTMLKAAYGGNESWSIVLATHGFVTGRNSWAVRIDESSTAYLFVGVAAAAVDREGFLGGDEHGWGLIGDGALYHRRAKARSYGHKFGEGDVVGVTLDMDVGTLSFSRNGVNLGVAFVGIRGKLFPAVAFYSRDQRATLTFVDGMTQCLCPGLGINVAGTSPAQPTLRQLVDAATLAESMVVPTVGVVGGVKAAAAEGATETSTDSADATGGLAGGDTAGAFVPTLPSSVVRPAFDSHCAWLAGHSLRCRTAARLDMELDVSPAACEVFGFRSGDEIASSALFHSATEWNSALDAGEDESEAVAAAAAAAAAAAGASSGGASGAAAEGGSASQTSSGGTPPRTAVATVLGVADNRLWVRWRADAEKGARGDAAAATEHATVVPRGDAWFISPQHLRKYPGDLKLVRRPEKEACAAPTGASAPCTLTTFATLVAPSFGWDVRCDTAIVQALNAAAVSLRCSPYNVPCADAVAACLPVLNR